VPAITLAEVDAPVVHTMHLPPSAPIVRAIDDARTRGDIAVACVSESSARAWRSVARVEAVLRNGVRVDSIPSSFVAGNGVLFAGRFSAEKGAAEAIEIARKAEQHLTLVGSPYDEAYFHRRIEPHRGDVTIIETLPRDELWELMAKSSAVLCPVQWDEPFGLVAAESQAAGTPVVAFARGALPEIVVDGLTGYLVEDVRGAIEAVQAIGAIDRVACRAHAEQSLSIEQTVEAHEKLYELSRASSGRLARPPAQRL
jgi:glycosyltransferase involved in cell wall biosynthesis